MKREKVKVEIVKSRDGSYKILQDGHFEKIDGCLCGASEIEKEWKTVIGAFRYCYSYADEIFFPQGFTFIKKFTK